MARLLALALLLSACVASPNARGPFELRDAAEPAIPAAESEAAWLPAIDAGLQADPAPDAGPAEQQPAAGELDAPVACTGERDGVTFVYSIDPAPPGELSATHCEVHDGRRTDRHDITTAPATPATRAGGCSGSTASPSRPTTTAPATCGWTARTTRTAARESFGGRGAR